MESTKTRVMIEYKNRILRKRKGRIFIKGEDVESHQMKLYCPIDIHTVAPLGFNVSSFSRGAAIQHFFSYFGCKFYHQLTRSHYPHYFPQDSLTLFLGFSSTLATKPRSDAWFLFRMLPPTVVESSGGY